jgi:hypothetical protein
MRDHNPSKQASRALSKDARRLLAGLCREGSFALRAETGGGLVLATADHRGVSLPGARFAASAGDELARLGLAQWQRHDRAERLSATAEGLARVAREAAPADLAFLAQHRRLENVTLQLDDGTRSDVVRDADESPLAWLARRRDGAGRPLIGHAALAAGERFRRDLTLARTLPRVTANWTAAVAAGPRSGPAGAELMIDAVLSARARVDAASRAVGPGLAGVLVDVCGFLKGLEEIERERGWPARSAKVVLGLGLSRLARHYGLAEEARGPLQGRMRAWADDGWQPAIS